MTQSHRSIPKIRRAIDGLTLGEQRDYLSICMRMARQMNAMRLSYNYGDSRDVFNSMASKLCNLHSGVRLSSANQSPRFVAATATTLSSTSLLSFLSLSQDDGCEITMRSHCNSNTIKTTSTTQISIPKLHLIERPFASPTAQQTRHLQ